MSIKEYSHSIYHVSFSLQAIGISVQEEDDDSVLKSFVELVEMVPKLVRPHLTATINLMLKVNVHIYDLLLELLGTLDC